MGARRIAGITVEIGGDTTKLTTALKDVDKALSTTQSSLRDLNKLGRKVLIMARAATRTANVFTRVDPETKEQVSIWVDRIKKQIVLDAEEPHSLAMPRLIPVKRIAFR